MTDEKRSIGGRIMMAALFVIGALPLATNVAANWITDREVHVFSEWLVGGGVVLSVIVANRADDMLVASGEKIGKMLTRFLPWYKGTQEHQQPPDSGGGV